jgi:hypothetical protein
MSTETCDACGGTGTVWTHRPDPQDDIELPCSECQPDAFNCWKCHDTGYIRNVWDRRKVMCADCAIDNGPDDEN